MYTKAKIDITEAAKAYAKLKKEVARIGILDRSYIYYSFMILITFIGLFSSLYLIYLSQSFLSLFAALILFVIVMAQITGLLHDSGHRAVFKSALANDILGYISCTFLAYTYRKWKINHNKHHSKPNDEDSDPDIERPVLAFSKKQLKSKNTFMKALIKYQAYLYYPLSFLTTLYTQFSGIYYFYKERDRVKAWEAFLYIIGISAWTVLPIAFFGLVKALIFLMFVHPVLSLYLFNIFAPNHKGMPLISKRQKISFLEQQIITSRNIKSGFLTDLLLIGLNYQIEHHLFTNCPRNKLKLITPHVKKLCRELGLEYTEVGIIETNRIILNELKQVAIRV